MNSNSAFRIGVAVCVVCGGMLSGHSHTHAEHAAPVQTPVVVQMSSTSSLASGSVAGFAVSTDGTVWTRPTSSAG